MSITVKDFVQEVSGKRFMNTQAGVDEKIQYFKDRLEIKTYLPFREKRKIAEMIVAQNMTEVDGIKKVDSVNQYIGFVVAMLTAHTAIEFGEDPVSDYDALAESGLLSQIIMCFKESYDESDIVLKMVLAMELEDNSVNALVGRFLNGLSDKLGGIGDALKNKVEGFDMSKLFGDIKQEDLTQLVGFMNKLK